MLSRRTKCRIRRRPRGWVRNDGTCVALSASQHGGWLRERQCELRQPQQGPSARPRSPACSTRPVAPATSARTAIFRAQRRITPTRCAPRTASATSAPASRTSSSESRTPATSTVTARSGELIAFGDADDTTPPPEDTPDAIVDTWLDSTAHRNLIQKPAYKRRGRRDQHPERDRLGHRGPRQAARRDDLALTSSHARAEPIRSSVVGWVPNSAIAQPGGSTSERLRSARRT